MKKRSPKILKIIVCVLISAVLGTCIAVMSAFMPTYLQKAEDFYVTEYGFPIPFVTQVTNIVPNPSYFPMYFAPKYGNESFETEVDTGLFALSAVIDSCICGAIVVVSVVLFSAYRRKHPKKTKIRKKEIYRPVFSEIDTNTQNFEDEKKD